jgi:anti-anti-sigma regulatory factor
MQRSETDLLIRLEDAVNVTSAEELKSLLLEGLVSGRDVHLDLERVEEIDVTVMQLLWAAGREADRKGTRMVTRVSEAAVAAARELGFNDFRGPRSGVADGQSNPHS